MPEGHVVHRQARQITTLFGGSTVVVSSPQGRFDAGARLLSGATLTKAEAYGKHLFVNFEPSSGPESHTLHIHLGLYGKWTMGKGAAPDPMGLIRVRLDSGAAFADLRGPTACDVLNPDERSAVIDRIGPDPIRRDARPDIAWSRVSQSRTSIAALLMDQKVFAGVGNIYRAEVLFRAGVNPMTPGRDIDRATFDEMWSDLVVLMRDGVKKGRIDTVRPAHMPKAMGRAPRQDRHGGEVYVYRRAALSCYVCGGEVQSADLAGRNLYWCASCQS